MINNNNESDPIIPVAISTFWHLSLDSWLSIIGVITGVLEIVTVSVIVTIIWSVLVSTGHWLVIVTVEMWGDISVEDIAQLIDVGSGIRVAIEI